MKIHFLYRTFYTLIVFSIIISACNPTKPYPKSTDNLRPLITSTLVQVTASPPTRSERSFSSITPGPTEAKHGVTEKNLVNTPTLVVNGNTIGGGSSSSDLKLKEEIYLGVGGGDPLPKCESVLAELINTPPTLMASSLFLGFGFPLGKIYVIGFPKNSEANVSITAIKETHIAGTKRLAFSDANELDGITCMELFVSWPLLEEEFLVKVSSDGFSYEKTLRFTLDETAVSLYPENTFDPLTHSFPYPTYKPGDKVIVRGTGFEINRQLPLGVYFTTAEKRDKAISEGKDPSAELIKSDVVVTDQTGSFLKTIVVAESSHPGIYYFVVKSSLEEETSTKTEVLLSDGLHDTGFFCANSPKTRLIVGDKAIVSSNPPLSNRVREKSGTSGKYLGDLKPGEQMDILEGPECADNMVWWKVRSLQTGLTGWTAEGDLRNYWLIPQN